MMIEHDVGSLLRHLGLEYDTDPQMKDTPARVARSFRELFAGLYEDEPRLATFPNTKRYNEMVFLGPIKVTSVCSHHLLPFFGSAFVAYVPGKTVVGVSKLVRIVRWLAARPQIQEELTEQVADYLVAKLKPVGAGVLISATHTCMAVRGVREDGGARMQTSALRG